ncbi:MAG: hypothetical protein EXR39_08205 [Betaproteobacteria bacterium]|nr:hypothetical protein [Betaproteobacteria bacterium]
MPDFWRNSGFHLLERRSDGLLAPTDDFLRAYFLRPEMRPVEESGPNERALHDALLDDPRRDIAPAVLAGIEDADVRFNYEVVLDFRRRLLLAGSVERCYLDIFRDARITVPPLFLDQLAQIMLRNVLDGTDDGLLARAGELLFREQKIHLDDGAIMAADDETVSHHVSGSAYGSLGRLIVEAQTPVRSVNLEVLDRDNAAAYWPRDQRHDFVISLNYGRASLDALARVMEQWIGHLLKLVVRIRPLRQIEDERWVWHVGLDADATTILNAMWRGEAVDQGDLRRLLCLFRLEFEDARLTRPEVGGRPVYLALAMNDQHLVRMKPQNLLLNLPLRQGM